MRKRTIIVFVFLLVTLAYAASSWFPEGGVAPHYQLIDSHGSVVSERDFAGRFQLIAFGYTYCPDICPTTLAEMSRIMGLLGARSSYLQPLFVTVDPERDTPEVLGRYTVFFHPRIIGLTGSPEQVRGVADRFKVRYEKHWATGAAQDKYTVDHSAGMYLLGPDGRFVGKFAYATPADKIAEKIGVLIEQAHLPPALKPAAE